ncbi:START domain-containing protein 10 [Haplosporangium sp. Z 767]|nr:START domain-containing protein 10 [Haplosporangium sp. Z 11]KAF9190759.1 START domain-containing protein 10 [Haplosporangium sp. Z 767]
MGESTQSPLAMLVLVTPYTILYLVNQLFLHGVLDNMHYFFFELIFVIAFRKVFGIPDLSERLFPAHVAVQATEAVRPAKTAIANESVRSSISEVESTVTKKKSKKSSRKTAAAPKKKKEHPFAKELVAMEKRFVDYLENTEIWEKVFEETSPELIEVYQYKARPMCYKIIAVMNNTPEVTFDLLCDITKRLTWDPLCVESKNLLDISPGVKLQYVRTKGIWPTASRDMLVLGTLKDLGEGRYCNFTTSVEHHIMPERKSEKIVRMETAVAGQVVGPEPGHPNKCRVIQVLDADLKGWIPDKVIQLVSTKAVPEGMRNVNNMLPSIEPYQVSKALENVAIAQKEETENDNTDTVEVASTHNLKQSKLDSALAPSVLSNGHLNGQIHNRAVVRKQPSTFRVFWDGMKENLGYGAESKKTGRVLVMTLLLAILGPRLAKLRRRRQ